MCRRILQCQYVDKELECADAIDVAGAGTLSVRSFESQRWREGSYEDEASWEGGGEQELRCKASTFEILDVERVRAHGTREETTHLLRCFFRTIIIVVNIARL